MRKRNKSRIFFGFIYLLILCAIGSLTAFANRYYEPLYKPSTTVTKAANKIEVDGNIDDPGWSAAAAIGNFTETYPGDNIAPLVDTRVMVTYDADNLYIAFVCLDDPTDIRATMCQRDQFSGDDAVSVMIDTYSNATWAYKLYVNPYGIQKDYLWTNIVGNDIGYDLIWNAAGKITDEGYQVEMAIPFSSIRFPQADIQSWKMDFVRTHPRGSSHQYRWAANDRNEQCGPCQWGTVEGISEVRPGKGIEILPTLIANQSGEVTDAQDPELPFENGNIDAELSLGGKYSISSDITVEASYNPDFSQIEADATQIDVNTPVALFFPERRPFFQEGQDIFRTLFNSFYTRTINDPEFAAKVIGRSGKYRFGMVSAVDENSYYLIPLEESSDRLFNVGKSYVNVFRGMRSFGESSQIGFLVNDRRYERGGYNTILALDQQIRLSRNYVLDGQYIATLTKESDNPSVYKGRLDPGTSFGDDIQTIGFDGESFTGYGFITRLRRFSRHWGFLINYDQVDKNYRTETGYDPWVNYRNFAVWSGYTFYFDNGLLERFTPQVYTETRWNFAGERKWTHVNTALEGNLRLAQTYFSLGFNNGIEKWSGIEFDKLWSVDLNLHCTPLSNIGVYFNGEYGVGPALYVLERGNEYSYTAGFDFKPIDRIIIEPEFSYLKSNQTETDGKLFENSVFRTRLRFQATKALSLRLVVQYAFSDLLYPLVNGQNVWLTDKHWDFDPLITYRLSPFSVFYIGSTLDYDRLPLDSNYKPAWNLSSRQFFMKLQYLFQT